MIDEKQIQQQLQQVLADINKLQQRTDKVGRAAEYASKGFVELNQEVKNIKLNWDQYNMRMSVLEGKVDSYIVMINQRFSDFQESIDKKLAVLQDKMDSNLKWNLGITFTMLAIFLTLIKLL